MVLGTRCELRIPDPSANPYLALAVQLAAGLDGIEKKADAREPVNTNIWEMSHREKRRLRIDDLPHNLEEACNELERDQVIKDALGEHITTNFLEAKRLRVAGVHHAGLAVGARQLPGEILDRAPS